MIPRLPGLPRDQPPPLVLVADEDPNVVEALLRALQSAHFRVATALDGDDALRRARHESPELVLASWRLPRRSGLELCDTLRREPENGDVPFLLLATNPDPERRIEALAHGADDLLAKPFSPRELVARVQRLVLRARASTRARRRSAELERDMLRMEGEVRRARSQAAEERALRVLTGGLVHEWLRLLDVDELDLRLLREAGRVTNARSSALLTPGADGEWRAGCVRGDLPERWRSFALPAVDQCLDWLGVLRRPVQREELERLPGMPAEIARLAMHGVSLLSPLATPSGDVVAVLVCEDRADGAPIGEPERARLGVLCEAAASVRVASREFREMEDRALQLLSDAHTRAPQRHEAAAEARRRLVPIARALSLGDAACGQLESALGLGPWVWSESGRAALAALAGERPSRRVGRLRELLREAQECGRDLSGPGEDELAWLAAAGLRYQSLRLAGRSEYESWRTAVGWLGLAFRPALREHFPEALEAAR